MQESVEVDEFGRPRSPLARLRKATLLAVIAGMLASIALWFAAAEHPPLQITLLFIIWVAAPYLLFIFGVRLSANWMPLTRRTFYFTTLLVTVVMVGVFIRDIFVPPQTSRAFVWVLASPTALGVVVLATIAAWLWGSRQSRNRE